MPKNHLRLLKNFFLLAIVVLVVLGFNKVLAQEPYPHVAEPETKTYSLPKPIADETIADLINRIAGYLTIIATPIATIMILIAAFKIMTTSDKPEKRQEAIKMIIWTAIGYAIILIGTGITSIIKEILGVKK